ncbi:MAG: hypothetical protein QM785_11000 [Pyrinomonadaceae bacterium]
MAKDVIHLHGQDLVVREDTAKAFRGVHWALWSIAAFVLISGVLFAIFFMGAASDGKIESPSQIESKRAN